MAPWGSVPGLTSFDHVVSRSIVSSPAIYVLTSDDSLKGWSPIIGIVTAIIGNILISFALNVQRYAHLRLNRDHDDREKSSSDQQPSQDPRHYGTNTDDPISDHNDPDGGSSQPHSPHSSASRSRSSSSYTLRAQSGAEKSGAGEGSKTYLQSPYWWAGILMMTIGEMGNFIAYGFAPASIVSPLGVVALVSNCVIAPFMLKERFRSRDFWGVVIAIAGAVTVVLSARNSEKQLGPHSIWDAITRWEFEVYLGVTVTLMLLGAWASEKYGQRTILIDLGLVGLFGGYTALSTKGIASLLSYTLWRALTFPVTYLLLAILIFTALMQVRYVNRALQRFDSTQVIPTQFVLFTISVIVGSAILYRDFEKADAAQVVKFVTGCALTFLGVYLITGGREGPESGGHDHGQSRGESTGQEATQKSTDRGQSDAAQPLLPRREQRDEFVSKAAQELSAQLDRPRGPRPSSRASDGLKSTGLVTSTTAGRSHSDSEQIVAPHLENPWADSRNRSGSAAGPLSGTSEATSSVAGESIEGPQTPRTGSFPSNRERATPGRAGTVSRRSVVGLIPDIYVSPLSSSLSTMVAESRRRGYDVTPTRTGTVRSLTGMPGQPSNRPSLSAGPSDPEDSRLDRSVTGLGGRSTLMPTEEAIPPSRQKAKAGLKKLARGLSSSVGNYLSRNRSDREGQTDGA
ncbi:MAG: hypothetical protein M1817_000202 [Caeruleum heppii]|nr:MAG: hypothetical protein M1817_000202 [Caeruleum heppii]